jgi:site-specific DNA-methyltransferase (adenine-specific)
MKPTITLLQGDCLEKLKELPDNSVDSIVTDPPYNLTTGGEKGFMGQKWDGSGITFNPDLWKECLRVLKPGGHLLSACGTRTYHRMAMAIETAGFEIRDVICWLYGSGFPKNYNIGKGVEAKLTIGSANWNEFRNLEGEATGFTKTNVEQGNMPKEYEPGRQFDLEPTEEGKKWNGWGSALKPSVELWTLARKPLEGSIVDTVLKYGTGGLNIDGCRVGNETISVHDAPKGTFAGGEEGRGSDTDTYREHQGRWPANLILECICETDNGKHTDPNCPCAMLDEQSGESTSSGGRIGVKDPNMFGYGGKYEKGDPDFGDFGGASRFFYCPKASREERNKGLSALPLPEKSVRDAEGDKENWDLSEGKVRARMVTEPQKNYHPTVKPVELMKYLCRLITPPKGVVIDPFMGSGTTGVAAKIEGFSFIGIELSPEYMEIAKARIAAVQTQTKLGDFE